MNSESRGNKGSRGKGGKVRRGAGEYEVQENTRSKGSKGSRGIKVFW